MLGKQLNLHEMFTEADLAREKQEKEQREREQREKELDSVPAEVRKYWQMILTDKVLAEKRQSLIRTDDFIPSSEFREFMTEINWYFKRMEAFRRAEKNTPYGSEREKAYFLVGNPQIADREYLDTASLYVNFKKSYEREMDLRNREAYKLKKQEEEKAKKKEKRKKRAEIKQEVEKTAAEERAEQIKNMRKSGRWLASGGESPDEE